ISSGCGRSDRFVCRELVPRVLLLMSICAGFSAVPEFFLPDPSRASQSLPFRMCAGPGIYLNSKTLPFSPRMLSRLQLESYDTNGFVVIENLLTPDDTSGIISEYEEIIDARANKLLEEGK